MTTVRDLHDIAMRLAQDAFVESEYGDPDRAAALAREALPYEVEAARMVERAPASEPTRSILYLSAASLAWQAGDMVQARALANDGISGSPPPRVEQDLRDLLARLDAA